MRIWSVVSNGGLECPSSTSTTCDHAFTLTRRKTAVTMMSKIELLFDTAYPSLTATFVGAVAVVQGRLSFFTTSDTTKPTESLSVRDPVVSDATTYDAPSLFAVTTPVPSTVTTVVLRDVNTSAPGFGRAVPAAVRTVTLSAAVPPAFIEKTFEPFGARTVIEAGAFGSAGVVVDEPHAAQIVSGNQYQKRLGRMLLTYSARRGGAAQRTRRAVSCTVMT